MKLYVDYDLAAPVKTNGAKAAEEVKEEKDLLELKISLLSAKNLPKTEVEKLIGELEADQAAAGDTRFLLAKLQQLAASSESEKKGTEETKPSGDSGTASATKEENAQKQIDLADQILAKVDFAQLVTDLAAVKLDSKKLLHSSAQAKRLVC